MMESLVNMLVNNGVAVVVVGYFLFTNYKFNEELTKTLTKITMILNNIDDELKERRDNENITGGDWFNKAFWVC